MFIHRAIEKEFLQLLDEYPIVTVLEPRQSGKTTLTKQLTSHEKIYQGELYDRHSAPLPFNFRNKISGIDFPLIARALHAGR
jgi:ABC-type polar amino acid transport system ATPase subunit